MVWECRCVVGLRRAPWTGACMLWVVGNTGRGPISPLKCWGSWSRTQTLAMPHVPSPALPPAKLGHGIVAEKSENPSSLPPFPKSPTATTEQARSFVGLNHWGSPFMAPLGKGEMGSVLSSAITCHEGYKSVKSRKSKMQPGNNWTSQLFQL